MKKIRYSCFRSNYSPFSDVSLKPDLESLGFEESSLRKAELIVCRNVKTARIASCLFPFKIILVWTHEPRFDSSREKVVRGFLGNKIYVFNVFTGDVFFHNSHFFGSYHYNQSIDLGINPIKLASIEQLVDQSTFDTRKCLVGAFAKKDPSHFCFSIRDVGNIDGNFIRQSLIEVALRLGLADVAGAGWGGLAIEESGFSGSDDDSWWNRKIELMRGYNFSIAIENTIYPYYVTEKIWQSIRALSLPVYVGKGSSIYELFPEASFVDYSSFSSNEDLLRYVSSMSYQEWCRRMELCINTYNSQVDLLLGSPPNRLEEVLQRVKDGIPV